MNGLLSRRTDELRLAVMLLSRLPAGRCRNPDLAMGSSLWAWPLVAIPLALVMVLTGWLAMAAGLPALAAGFLMLMAQALLTGGLHEDGLADCADAMGAGGSRERRLEIMRDSRIGSFGAIALMTTIGLRASLLAGVLETAPGAANQFAVLLCAMMLGRASVGLVMLWLTPARSNGLGAASASGVTAGRVVVALAVSLSALAGSVFWCGLPVPTAGAMVAAVMVTGSAVALWARSKLGGYSGDTLGAGILLTETAVLVV